MEEKKHTKTSGVNAFIKLMKKTMFDRSQVLCWVQREGKRVIRKVQIEKIMVPQKQIAVKIFPADKQFIDAVFANKYLNFFITDNACLFKLSLDELKNDLVLFKMPEDFVRLERRKHLRLQTKGLFSETNLYFSKISKNSVLKTFKKAVNDFSSAGASISVTPSQANDIDDSEYIKRVRVENEMLDFEVNAVVIYKKQMEAQGFVRDSWRVGLEFLDVNPKQKALIERYILSSVKGTEQE